MLKIKNIYSHKNNVKKYNYNLSYDYLYIHLLLKYAHSDRQRITLIILFYVICMHLET